LEVTAIVRRQGGTQSDGRRSPQPAAMAPMRISATDMKQRTSWKPRSASTYRFAEECQLKIQEAISVSTTILFIEARRAPPPRAAQRILLLQNAPSHRQAPDRYSATAPQWTSVLDARPQAIRLRPELSGSRRSCLASAQDFINRHISQPRRRYVKTSRGRGPADHTGLAQLGRQRSSSRSL
jgi:hypothetical protein